MRRAFVTVLLAFLGPAVAHAGPGEVGTDKLAERVSAECRRAGVQSDEQCRSGIGREVIRAEVDRHASTWLHRTLSHQRRLGDALPFAEAPWIGTHNSFNSTSELPTLSHTDSNQQLSLVDQLRLDVRSLELDVHWPPVRPSTSGLEPVVCHGRGPAGCSTERSLREHLLDVRGWLDANRGEVVLLYLEDQMDDPRGYEAGAAVVRDVLGARLYAPRGTTGCRPLPLHLTRAGVRASRAQVVVVGDCGRGAWQAVSHAWPASVRFEDRARRWTCAQLPENKASRIVRYFEDSTFLAQTPASSADDGLTPATTRAMDTCGVDLTGFDQLLPLDGRLDALAWSWAKGEPAAAAPAVQRADGRWRSARTPAVRRAACRLGRGWRLTTAVLRRRAVSACAALGATFAPPRSARENAALLAARGGAGGEVWVGA